MTISKLVQPIVQPIAKRITDPTAMPLADPLLLDTYGFAGVAFSTRKLKNSYSGNCVTVRRSSDNAEQAFGFSDGWLDVSAIETFCGVGDGFVKTWHDQSGNGRDVSQSTTSAQPQICSSGSVLLENSKPVLSLNGTSHYLSPASTITIDVASLFCICKTDETSNNGLLDADDYVRVGSNNVAYRSNAFDQHALTLDDTQRLVTVIAAGVSDPRAVSVWGNGTASADNPNSLNILTQINEVFRRGATRYFEGTCNELIIFTDDKTDDRAAIETDINTAFGVY